MTEIITSLTIAQIPEEQPENRTIIVEHDAAVATKAVDEDDVKSETSTIRHDPSRSKHFNTRLSE
jgi:hypothetical protein